MEREGERERERGEGEGKRERKGEREDSRERERETFQIVWYLTSAVIFATSSRYSVDVELLYSGMKSRLI